MTETMTAPDVNEYPILFTSELVNAIIRGEKTVTRRVVKPQPPPPDKYHALGCPPYKYEGRSHYSFGRQQGEWYYDLQTDVDESMCLHIPCPYGQPGDVLWVRESHKIDHAYEERADDGSVMKIVQGTYSDGKFFDVELTADEAEKFEARKYPFRKLSGRFMYRSLCRIRLRVEDVRIERLQQITGRDAQAEGISQPLPDWSADEDEDPKPGTFPALRREFADLWDEINADRGYPWEDDPWVWVVQFEKLPST